MKTLAIALVSLCLTLPFFGESEDTTLQSETTTYYLIRHAEKDRSDKTNSNPSLTEAGSQRAEQWSKIFEHVNFDMVYSTDYNRTKETALPTAKKNGLELTIYNPRASFTDAFKNETKGKTVLIVGHSNTTPMFANAIIGQKKYAQMDDSNNGNLYIVTINNEVKTDQLLVFN